jgi:hypothetical protein
MVNFENGDYWILGPVNVISVNPLPVTVNGKYLHGSMINPKTDRNQGYNSDVPNYVSSLSVTFPKIVNPGESLVSTRSGTPPDYSDVWPDLSGVFWSSRIYSCIYQRRFSFDCA